MLLPGLAACESKGAHFKLQVLIQLLGGVRSGQGVHGLAPELQCALLWGLGVWGCKGGEWGFFPVALQKAQGAQQEDLVSVPGAAGCHARMLPSLGQRRNSYGSSPARPRTGVWCIRSSLTTRTSNCFPGHRDNRRGVRRASTKRAQRGSLE